MKRTHPRLTALAACLVLGAGAAIPAAATAASPLRVKVPAPKISKPRTNALGALANLNGRYGALTTRVKSCASAAGDLKTAKSTRAKAYTKLKRASLKSLGVRKKQMQSVVVRLSRAAQRCATSSTVTNTVIIPGAPGGLGGGASSGGAAGFNGAAGTGGTGGPGGSTPPGVVTAGVTLPDILGGSALDLGGLLGGTSLPGIPQLVSVGDLGSPTCVVDDAVCVGVDVPALEAALTELVGRNDLLGQLLGVDLSGLLAQVTSLLDTGQLGSLFNVQRVGDQVIRVVPTGPLAGLTGLTGIPVTQVVRLQVS